MTIPDIVTKDLEIATNALTPPFTRVPQPSSSSSEPFRKLSTLMQNAKNLVGGAKKRKAPTITVSLANFVSVMSMMYRDSVFNGKTILIPDNYSLYYAHEKLVDHDAHDAKYAKKTTGSKKPAIPQAADVNESTKKRHAESLYLEIIMQLAQDLESRGAIFQFSREALKYFLATRKRFVSHNDFLETNNIVKADKSKSKLSQLLPGMILMEYLKGIDMFTSSLRRAYKEDVTALKMIIDCDISIPVQIYSVVRHAEYHQTKYCDTENGNLSTLGYAKIPIPNSAFKRAQIIVTRYLVLVMDSNQFLINSTIEKDFTQILIDSYKSLKTEEYLVFDASVGVKSKVIDLVGMSVNGQTLSDVYTNRLAFISSRYPNAKILKPTNDATNSNYIFKPINGFSVSYIQLKPLLTAAIVGISDRFAYAALINDDNDNDKELVVVNRFGVSGAATCMIATAEFQSDENRQACSILVGGETYRVTGDLESVTLFTEAVLVEIKDANKFAGISTRPVSTREEYKQLYQATKDLKSNDVFIEMFNDPSRAEEIVELLTNSVNFERMKAMIESKMQFTPSF